MKGTYLIGYIETKDKRLLKSVKFVKNAMFDICNSLKLNIIGENYHVFKSHSGITYCFILSQSHFVVHTWPEESKIYFDIFTCNTKLSNDDFINALSSKFKGNVKEVKKIGYSV